MSLGQLAVGAVVLIAGAIFAWVDRPWTWKSAAIFILLGAALATVTASVLYIGRDALGFHTDLVALLTLRPASFGAVFIPIGYALVVKGVVAAALLFMRNVFVSVSKS